MRDAVLRTQRSIIFELHLALVFVLQREGRQSEPSQQRQGIHVAGDGSPYRATVPSAW